MLDADRTEEASRKGQGRNGGGDKPALAFTFSWECQKCLPLLRSLHTLPELTVISDRPSNVGRLISSLNSNRKTTLVLPRVEPQAIELVCTHHLGVAIGNKSIITRHVWAVVYIRVFSPPVFSLSLSLSLSNKCKYLNPKILRKYC